MKAVFLVVLIALCAAQHTEASPASASTRDLNDLVARLKDAIEQAIQKINELDVADLQAALAAAAEKLRDVLNDAVNNANQIIVDLVDAAAEAGKNVGHCVENKDADLEEIKNETKAAIVACNQEAVASVQPALANVREVVAEARQLKQDVEDAVSSCTSSAAEYAFDKDVAKCLISELIPLKSRVAALLSNAHAAVEEAKAVSEAAAKSASACSRAALVDASTKTSDVVTEITNCIANA